MATKYPKSTQTGEEGVALVRTIATDAGAVYRPFDNPDLGVDGTVELLTDDREPSGDLVLVQIKSGPSYVRSLLRRCHSLALRDMGPLRRARRRRRLRSRRQRGPLGRHLGAPP